MACDFILDSDEHGEFCVIPLGPTGKLFAKIDPDDFEKTGKHNWCCWSNPKGSIKYAVRRIKINGKAKLRQMHRDILDIENSKVFADHVNGDGLDNRRFNLRVATHSQNQWNQKPKGGTSQYKGVCWHIRDNVWNAALTYLGRRIWIGQFSSEIVGGVDIGEVKAAKAYDQAAKKYFGVFARLNFPEETMTVYKMSEEDEKKAIKLIAECRADTVSQTGGILANRKVAELELMCKYLGCNISQLAGKIVSGILT
jgi:hypothetical protein